MELEINWNLYRWYQRKQGSAMVPYGSVGAKILYREPYLSLVGANPMTEKIQDEKELEVATQRLCQKNLWCSINWNIKL